RVDDGRDGVGGVVEPVDELEAEGHGEADDQDEEAGGGEIRQGGRHGGWRLALARSSAKGTAIGSGEETVTNVQARRDESDARGPVYAASQGCCTWLNTGSARVHPTCWSDHVGGAHMGFHWPELFVIGVIALLIFGPRRLPEMGNTLGKALGEFKKSMNEAPPPTPSDAPVPHHEAR